MILNLQSTVIIDVTDYLPLKLQAWWTDQAQEDAQQLFGQMPVLFEAVHQAYRPAAPDASAGGFW
jgi:hypothetical protein